MIIAINGKIGSGKDTIGKIIQYLTSGSADIMSYEEYQTSQSKYRYDSTWEIRKFADKLKDIVCLLIGCTRKDLENQDFKNKELGEEWWYWDIDKYPNLPDNCLKLTPRLLLQLLGTECGRDIIHPNIWVNSLFSEYYNYGSYTTWNSSIQKDGVPTKLEPNWIITDLRFPNELDAVHDRKGIAIKVKRDNCTCTMKEVASCEKVCRINSNYKEHESETALDFRADFKYIIDNNGTIEELINEVKIILQKEKLI